MNRKGFPIEPQKWQNEHECFTAGTDQTSTVHIFQWFAELIN